MDNPRKALCLSGPFKSFMATPLRSSLSHDHSRTLNHPAPSRRGPLRDSTEDRWIGLNMNYSIIFTEISFSPETSILLQIIQIIHMTLGIIPESDREGRAVCQSWLQGGKHNVTPTDKNSVSRESPWDLLTYPPPFKEGRRLQGSPPKKQHKVI